MNAFDVEHVGQDFGFDSSLRIVTFKTCDDSGLVANAYPRPRLTWKLEGSRNGVLQHGYELQRCPDLTFADPITAAVSSSFPEAEWIGPDLSSREIAWCRV